MSNFIARLRHKPEHERQRIAIMIPIIVTLLIALIWAFFFVYSVSSSKTLTTPGPIVELFDSFKQMTKNIGDTFTGTPTEVKE